MDDFGPVLHHQHNLPKEHCACLYIGHNSPRIFRKVHFDDSNYHMNVARCFHKNAVADNSDLTLDSVELNVISYWPNATFTRLCLDIANRIRSSATNRHAVSSNRVSLALALLNVPYAANMATACFISMSTSTASTSKNCRMSLDLAGIQAEVVNDQRKNAQTA